MFFQLKYPVQIRKWWKIKRFQISYSSQTKHQDEMHNLGPGEIHAWSHDMKQIPQNSDNKSLCRIQYSHPVFEEHHSMSLSAESFLNERHDVILSLLHCLQSSLLLGELFFLCSINSLHRSTVTHKKPSETLKRRNQCESVQYSCC